MITMTPEQAYAGMFYFLEDFYCRTQSDEIGGLLGDMALLADGRPADSAVSTDWLRAVQKAMTEGSAGVGFRIVKD